LVNWVVYFHFEAQNGNDTPIFRTTKAESLSLRAEVDFVVYGSQGLRAIEVKNAVRIHPQDLRGLKAFREDYPEAEGCLLYRGKDRLVKEGILCLPCDRFLSSLRPPAWPE